MGISRIPGCQQNNYGFSLMQKIISLSFFAFFMFFNSTIACPSEESNSSFIPKERYNQPWRLSSYLRDAGLLNKSIQYLTFMKNSDTWVSTAEGLYCYDGFLWKHYTVKDGLPSNNIRTTCEAKDGRLWIGTDNGVCYFDGKQFITVDPQNTLASPSVRRIIETANNELWFCCDRWPDASFSGGLTVYKNNQWKSFFEQDGLPSNNTLSYLRDSKGREFVITSKGVAQRVRDNWNTVLSIRSDLNDEVPWDMCESSKYGIIIITDNSLFILKEDQWKKVHYSTMDSISNQRRLCATHDGNVYTCLETDEFHNAFFQWNGDSFEQVSAPFTSPKITVTSIAEAPENSICCTGDNLLLRWNISKYKEWTEFTGLSTPRFLDNQNRLWFIGEKNNRLLSGEKWEPIEQPIKNAILDNQKNVWGWDQNQLFCWTDKTILHFDENQTTLRNIQQVISHPTDGLFLWGKNAENVDTVVRFFDSKWNILPLPDVKNSQLKSIQNAPQGGIWFFVSSKEQQSNRIFYYCNQEIKEIPINKPLQNPLLSNFVIDKQGAIWLYGQSGLYHLSQENKDKWEKITKLPGKVISACVSSQSEIWVSYLSGLGNNQGIARYREGEWKTIPSDYCTFASAAPDQTVYFTGSGVLYAFSPKNDIIPDVITIPVSRPISSVVKDSENNLWLMIGESVFRYIKDEYPCSTFIQGETDFVTGTSIQFTFTAKEAYSPYASKEHFQYSWKLDSSPWTHFSPENGVQISPSQINHGSHTIQVRSRDEESCIDQTPAKKTFYVHSKPLQEKSWFLAAVTFIFGIILVLSAIAFITTRKLAKYTSSLETIVQQRTEALLESEQRLHTILSNSATLISLKDTKGHYILTNRTYEKFVNASLQDILGKTDFDFFAETYANQFINNDRLVLETKTPMEFEETIVKKGQTITLISTKAPLFDDNGEPFAISSISTDITARKEAEKALQQAEELFRILVENSLVGIYILQSERILYCNPRFAEIFKYSQHDMFSMNLVENLVTPECQPLVYENIKKNLQNTHSKTHYIFTGQCKNQDQIVVEAITAPIFYQGKPAIIGTILDITDRKKAEEEKKNLEGQLRQSQKMEAIGQLAGGIAHDFNNLLTIIIGYSSILKNHLHTNDAKPFTILAEIKNAADQAASMTSQLLAFSRKQILNPETLSLNMVIDGLTSMMKRLLGEQIQIEIHQDKNLGFVKADPVQMKQVILNLAINARDAMPEGGMLTIKTNKTCLDEEYAKKHIDITPGHYAQITIADTGSGIAQSIIPRIFEPFFTTKEMDKGTGLGLSMVYGIVKQSGGHIWVESEINKGTVFHIVLPLIHILSSIPEDTQAPHQPAKGRETILLVEDEEAVRELTREILMDFGYHVIDTNSPEEAIRIYQKSQDMIRLILSDVVMPKMCGPEMMKEIYTINPQVKVIYMSGYTDDTITKYGIMNQGVNFIQKPFTPELMAEKVRQFLDQ